MKANEFAIELSRFAEEVKAEHVRLMKKVTLELLGRVTQKSPVDTGRFRANWMVGINATDYTTTESTVNDTIERGMATLTPLAFGEAIHVSNNLPYANKLEHGYSGQAPEGILSVSVEEIKAFLK